MIRKPRKAKVRISRKNRLSKRDIIQSGLYAFYAAIVGTILDILTTWGNTNSFYFDPKILIMGLKFSFITGISAMIQKWRDANKIVVTNVPEDILDMIKTSNSVSIQTDEDRMVVDNPDMKNR